MKPHNRTKWWQACSVAHDLQIIFRLLVCQCVLRFCVGGESIGKGWAEKGPTELVCGAPPWREDRGVDYLDAIDLLEMVLERQVEL